MDDLRSSLRYERPGLVEFDEVIPWSPEYRDRFQIDEEVADPIVSAAVDAC